MKGFPFTPESMQIIQMCWSVQSNFFRIAELKGMENKPVTPTSLFGIVVRFISKFSEIKLQSRKKNPLGMYCVFWLCVCEDNWSSSVQRQLCVLATTTPPDMWRKGSAICPLRNAEFGEALAIHKGHSNSYCKLKWHLICICTSRLFCMPVGILTHF